MRCMYLLITGFVGIIFWSPSTYAANCQNSPVLFAYGGSLYSVSASSEPAKIASGFISPSDLSWAPGCTNYALIDSGALWIGTLGKQPRQIGIPGHIFERTQYGLPPYEWSPDGSQLAVAARPAACGEPPSESRFGDGNIYIVSVARLSERPLTYDCKNHLLAWSQSGDQLAIAHEALSPCPESVHICPTADVIAINLSSELRTTLIRAVALRQKRLNDPEVIKWDSQRGILYIRNVTLLIGGLGSLLALKLPSEKVLWAVECYGVTRLNGGAFAIPFRETKEVQNPEVSWNWRWEVIRENGETSLRYPILLSSGGGEEGTISPDGKYIVWESRELRQQTTTLHFATLNSDDSWAHTLPTGFETRSKTWTPSGYLVVVSLMKSNGGSTRLQLRLLDPQGRISRMLFERDIPLSPGQTPDFTRYTAIQRPDGTIESVNQPLVVASWQR